MNEDYIEFVLTVKGFTMTKEYLEVSDGKKRSYYH